MRHFRHPNLLQLHDVLLVEAGGELYMSMELMDCDLDRLVRGRGVALEENQCRDFCSKVFLGLLHLHCGHVIHRDLKPANIFIRLKTKEVKIGDLGLSRGIAVDGETGEAIHPLEEQLTEYVVTRWYRAPEVLLARSKYGPKVDVWSVGCILYEMWTAKALFPGKNSLDQLTKVMGIMGIPSEEDQWWVPEESKPMLLRCSRERPAKGFSRMQGIPVGHGADLLARLLAFDPSRRLSVEAALQHPYLESFASGQVDRAKDVKPADVSYDTQYDGLSKGGEATASAKLSRMLRQEAASRRPLSRESAEASRVPFRQAATEGVSEKPRATSQSRRERRPTLAASRSYQKIHVSPRRSEPNPEILPADLLESPKAPQAPPPAETAPMEVAGHLDSPSISTPTRRDKHVVPAAAIPAPGAGKLRSRTAWKKALVAAHQARATLALETRQELLTPPKLSRDKEATRATFNEEAAITLELDKLQLLQDQQEKKLQRFLDQNLISSLSHVEISMGRRFSLPVDGRVKLDLARDAAKLASQSVAKQGTGVIPRDVRPVDISTVLDSPSGPLRTAAASACDHAGLESLEPERQVKSSKTASRASPRRKGQQPQQSQSATPRQRRPSAVQSSPRKAGDGRSASPGLARRKDSRGTQPMSQKADSFRSKSPSATGARPQKLPAPPPETKALERGRADPSEAPPAPLAARRHSDAPILRRENPFDASKTKTRPAGESKDKVPLETLRILRPKDVVTEAQETPTDLDSPLHRSHCVQPEPSEHCDGRRTGALAAWPVCPADLGDDELDFAAPAFPQPAMRAA